METRPHHLDARPGVVDRRRIPDRRAAWRGGRRDSDWKHRPLDARLWTVEKPPRRAWLAPFGILRAVVRGLRLAPAPSPRC
jgi:hypothetical protein